MDQARYLLIYEYFASRIRFGYYQKGDVLPPIEQLCEKFQVARKTVRNALLQLKEDGFISFSAGKRATVICDVAQWEQKLSAGNYYRARKDAILDFNYSASRLIAPLLAAGCHRVENKEIRTLGEVALCPFIEDADYSLIGCLTMLGKLDNRLMINLLQETIRFFQFPFLQKLSHASTQSAFLMQVRLEMYACSQRGDLEGFFTAVMRLQNQFYFAIKEYIQLTDDGTPWPEQVPFTWQIYRERPQLCYTLAAKLLHQIISGVYPEESFLPSYAAIATEYQVSVITARRTIEILHHLGVAQTRNGVGTQVVCAPPQIEKLRRPAIQKQLDRLNQSVQITLLTCNTVAKEAFATATLQNRQELHRQLTHGLQQQDWFVFISLNVHFLLRPYSSPSMKTICHKLYGFLLWGYPFLRFHRAETGLYANAAQILQGLKANESAIFSAGFKGLLRQMSNIVKKYFA